MGEPGGLPSVGSHRIRHDWSDLAAAAAAALQVGTLPTELWGKPHAARQRMGKCYLVGKYASQTILGPNAWFEMHISRLDSTVFTHSLSCHPSWPLLIPGNSRTFLPLTFWLFLKCLSFPWKKKSSTFMAHCRWCLFQEVFSNFSRPDVIFSIIKSHCGVCVPH